MMDLTLLTPHLPKRKNMSVNADKTMERCLAAWKNLKNVQKNEVLELADVSAATLHKTYKQGHISAGVAIALAKVAGLSPQYLCGGADKAGKFTARTLNTFLETNGIHNPYEAPEEEKPEPALFVAAPPAEAVCDICGMDDDDDDGMDSEELAILLESLIIRSYYRKDCAERLLKVTELLLGD